MRYQIYNRLLHGKIVGNLHGFHFYETANKLSVFPINRLLDGEMRHRFNQEEDERKGNIPFVLLPEKHELLAVAPSWSDREIVAIAQREEKRGREERRKERRKFFNEKNTAPFKISFGDLVNVKK